MPQMVRTSSEEAGGTKNVKKIFFIEKNIQYLRLIFAENA
jgi:hypothetical protein